MKIGFVGDIHGRVFLALAIIHEWQIRHNEKLDMIIQVGDLGAYPEPSEELKNNKFYQEDPSQFDFCKFIRADGSMADDLHRMREKLASPIYFIRGNHEDFGWLHNLSCKSGEIFTRIDPFDLFHYAPDGAILENNNTRIAFLGGIETPRPKESSINEVALAKLLTHAPGEIDILVTHDAPYGIGTNYLGQVQGSAKITQLIETIQPKYLIAGHYHHRIGPTIYGKTKYLGLNVLIHLRQDPSGCVQPGCLAILDTEKDELTFVTDDWLAGFDKDFDFAQYCKQTGGPPKRGGSVDG